MTPDGHAPWEVDAELADVVPLVEAADRLGYDYVTCSEHVAIPDDVAPVRGGRYWDPLATFGYLERGHRRASASRPTCSCSATTTRSRSPSATAPSTASPAGGSSSASASDRSQQEFELLGAPFDDRGARGDESLRALRTSFGRREPEFHGEYFDYSGMIVDPCGVQETVPLWIGGRTHAIAAARGRAGRRLGAVRSPPRRARRHVGPGPRVRVVGRAAVGGGPPAVRGVAARRASCSIRSASPTTATDVLVALRDIGATMVNVNFRHRSPEHYLEQLEALAELARDV